MNPKLVACLAGSMVVGATGAVGALVAGWGILAAVGAYSLGGSVSLVPIAALAFREPRPERSVTTQNGGRSKPATAFS